MSTTTLPPRGFTNHSVGHEPFRITLAPCQIPGGLALTVTGPDDFKGTARILEDLAGERWAAILRTGDLSPLEEIAHPLIGPALEAAGVAAQEFLDRNEEAVRAIWLEGTVALRELRKAYGQDYASEFEATMARRIGVPLETLKAAAYAHGPSPDAPADDLEGFARALDAAGAHSLAWWVYDRRDETFDDAFVMGFARERDEFDADPLPDDPMRMRDVPIPGRTDDDLARYMERTFDAFHATSPAPSGA
jgi:hypothetical protein